MIPRRSVREFMSSVPITIAPEAPVVGAIQTLLQERVSGLPVVDDDGKLVGIVTEQDCLKAAHQDSYYGEPRYRVERIMSREIVSIDPDVDVAVAIELFLSHPYRRLPVVKDGALLGVLSRRDCLKALLAVAALGS